jgi:hypothetical protein
MAEKGEIVMMFTGSDSIGIVSAATSVDQAVSFLLAPTSARSLVSILIFGFVSRSL